MAIAEGEHNLKKIMKKPVLAVVAAAGIIGGITPILANASSFGSPSATKVVMNEEGKEVTRYNLKELAKNDPQTLNMLLKTQAEHLYIIVDELKLNTKLQTYMEENKEEWERVYNDYYSDIWLEVRYAEDQSQDEIVSVSAQTQNGKVYVKGIVAKDVTKVVVKKPNGDDIEVVPTSEHSFTVTFAAANLAVEQYAEVQAFAGSTLVDSEKVKIVPQAEEAADLIIHQMAVLDAKKGELQVKGIVKLDADKVTVSYDGVKSDAKVKKLWDGVGSFSITLKNVKATSGKVLIEVYTDGQKRDSESAEVEVVNAPAQQPVKTYSISDTAVLDAKGKNVKVKGNVVGWEKKADVKLYIFGPDGKKHEVKPNDKGEYTANLPLKNKSWSEGSVHLELYVSGKLVKQADITHVEKTVVETGKKEKEEKHPKGKAYGYWAKHGQSNDQDDDDDDDDDDEDDDRD